MGLEGAGMIDRGARENGEAVRWVTACGGENIHVVLQGRPSNETYGLTWISVDVGGNMRETKECQLLLGRSKSCVVRKGVNEGVPTSGGNTPLVGRLCLASPLQTPPLSAPGLCTGLRAVDR